MRANKIAITAFIISIAASSCLTDTIIPDVVIDYNEKLVVNSVLNNTTGISVQVTNSSAAFGSDIPLSVSDASVRVLQNATEHVLVYDAFEAAYESSAVMASGDAITVEVDHPDFVNARAVFRMPEEIVATGNLVPNGGKDTSGFDSDLISVSFTDDASRTNFYRLNFYYLNETINQYIPMAFSTTDPSLSAYNSLSLNDGSILFTDELFNGKSKEFATVAPFGLVLGNTGDKYMIEISNISSDLYRYYQSLQRAQEAKEITFNGGYDNAVVIHTNITQGLGIAGGISTRQVILK